MKKSFLIMIALTFLTTFAFAGGDQNQNRHDGELGAGPTQQQRIDNPNKDALQVSQLSEDQKDHIYSIYEEEKLARDVYRILGGAFPGENTFTNIQLSEQTHMDAVRNLCDKYGIEINLSDETGAFTIPDMKDFYEAVYQDFVVSQGSLIEALYVGIDIEEMDILDLIYALNVLAPDGVPRDIYNVLTNLKNGSSNHLDAFLNALARAGAQ